MSNTIDERVVILKFDNKDFESNAQQSLSTLDKLDQKLKLDNASKSLSGIAVTSKSLGLESISSNIEGLSKRFSALGIIGMTALQEITRSAMQAGAALVNHVVGPITEGGKNRAFNIENARFQLQGLITEAQGGAAEVEAIMNDAKESVNDTAFAYDEAAKAASMFAASGMRSGEQMQMALKGIAGVAATTNTDYEGMARIFTTVSGQGRVMGDQLLQLSVRGLNAAATISDYMNSVIDGTGRASDSVKQYVNEITGGMKITEADVREMVTSGLISFDLFSSAMGETFGDHAKEANATFNGSLANIKAALARTGALFYSPLIQQNGPIVQLFNNIKGRINDINGMLGPFATALTGAINKVVTWFSRMVSAWDLSWIGRVSERLGETINKFFGLGEAVEELAGKPKEAIEQLNEAVKMITPEEAQAAWDIWNKGIYVNGEARKKALEEAGLSYENVQGYVNELIEAEFDLSKVETQVGETGTEANEKVTTAQEKVNQAIERQKKELTPALKVWVTLKNTLGGVGNIFKNITSAIAKVASKLKTSMKPVEGILDTVMVASYRFWEFTKSMQLSDTAAERIAKALSTVFNAMTNVASIALKVISVFGTGLFKALSLAGNGFSKLGGFVGGALDKLGGFSGIATKIGNAFKKLKETIGKSEGFKSFKLELKAVGDYIGANFLPVFKKLIDKIKEFAETKLPSIETIGKAIGVALGNIGSFISQIKEGKTFVNDFFAAVKGKFKIGELFGGIEDSDTGKAEGFLGKLAKIKDKIVSFVSGVFSSDTATGAFEKIKEFFGKIRDVLDGIDWDHLIDTAMSMIKLYAAFKLIKSFSKLSDSLSGMFSSISGLAAAAKTKVKMESLKTFAASVTILAAAVFILSQIPSDKLESSMWAMEVALLSMLGVVAVLDKVNASMGNMIGIGVAFAGMGAGLLMVGLAAKQIATMKPEELIQAGIAIGALVAVMAIAAKLAGGIGGVGFASMALSIYLLAPALMVLANVPFDSVLSAAKNLALIMIPLAAASRLAGGAAGGALKMLALALAVDLTIPALLLLAFTPMGKAIRGAVLLSGVMLALGGAARLAGSAKEGASAMLAAAVAAVAAAVAIVVIGGMDFLAVAQAVGSIVLVMASIAAASHVVSKAKEGAIGIMGVLAVMTIAFVILVNLSPENVLSVALSLSVVLLALTAAIGVLGSMPITTGATAALNLLEFLGIMGAAMVGLGELFNKFEGLDAAMDKGIQVLSRISEGFGEIIASFGKGLSSTLPAIGENLGQFYTNAQPFFDGMKGFDGSILSGISDLAGALVKFTGDNILDNLQKFFTGKSSLSQIGTQLSEFGKPLVEFANSVKDVPEDAPDKAGTAIGIARTVSQKAEGVKPVKIELGEGLVEFGKQISIYAAVIAKAPIDAAKNATGTIRGVVGLVSSINQNGGDSAILASFGMNLKDFGNDFAAFASKAGSVALDSVQGLINSCKDLATFAGSLDAGSLTALGTFVGSMKAFISGLTSATASASTVNAGSLNGIQSTIAALTNIVKSASAVNTASFSKFVQSFNDIGKKGVDGFVKAFTGSVGTVRSAATSLVSSASSGVSGGAGQMSSAGVNLMRGLANGIAAGRSAAVNAAIAAMRAAVAAAKAAGGVHSPSTIFYAIGNFLDQGLINGIRAGLGRISSAGAAMAEHAKDGMETALDTISAILNSDIDSNPTITPVLDLSGVESGATRLNSLLDDRYGIALTGRVGTVAAAMGSQNGSSNDDLIKAIKHMNNNRGDTHNWNITVDGTENPENFVDRMVRDVRRRKRMS